MRIQLLFNNLSLSLSLVRVRVTFRKHLRCLIGLHYRLTPLSRGQSRGTAIIARAHMCVDITRNTSRRETEEESHRANSKRRITPEL